MGTFIKSLEVWKASEEIRIYIIDAFWALWIFPELKLNKCYTIFCTIQEIKIKFTHVEYDFVFIFFLNQTILK